MISYTDDVPVRALQLVRQFVDLSSRMMCSYIPCTYAFIVMEDVVSSVISNTNLRRITPTRFSARPHNIIVIQVYAPS
ncbi:hypothetical protein DPMN_094145 [Dreissena polymorpha]|uniref:Uncharacterized protein n=1 Tax=Dreissena polymorpha TaxID=45954 RepID=A0A9D4L487_DREPO|nr:hypothetical protein DPMN_094145 [Dreissena polymorpha]